MKDYNAIELDRFVRFCLESYSAYKNHPIFRYSYEELRDLINREIESYCILNGKIWSDIPRDFIKELEHIW